MNEQPKYNEDLPEQQPGGERAIPYKRWENLYGKKVKMNDRFETEHSWCEELAIQNAGRWIPILLPSSPTQSQEVETKQVHQSADAIQAIIDKHKQGYKDHKGLQKYFISDKNFDHLIHDLASLSPSTERGFTREDMEKTYRAGFNDDTDDGAENYVTELLTTYMPPSIERKSDAAAFLDWYLKESPVWCKEDADGFYNPISDKDMSTKELYQLFLTSIK